ncbi:MAG: hypothetical protein ACYDHZ_03095 [Dehalococcoidia bacterium]
MSDDLKKLYLVIGAKMDEAQKGLNQLQGSVDQFNGHLSTMGSLVSNLLPAVTVAGVVYGFKQMMESSAQYGDAVMLMKEKTGLSVEMIQKLKYGTETTGTSIDDLAVGMRNLNKVLADAFAGNKEAIKFLENLGLKIDDLEKMNPDQRFMAVATAIGQIKDIAVESTAAIGAFGRSGPDLIPLINNLDKIFAYADKNLNIMSEKDIQNLADGAKAIVDLDTQWNALKNSLATTIWPTLKPLLDDIRQLIQLLVNAKNALDSVNSWMDINIPGHNINLTPGSNFGKNLHNYDIGGTVPGPIGMPVPIMARGGERYLGAQGDSAGESVRVIINNPVMQSNANITAMTQQVARELKRLKTLKG